MSPMIASASENSPPAPSPAPPGTGKGPDEVASVQSIDPTVKIEIAAMKKGLRP